MRAYIDGRDGGARGSHRDWAATGFSGASELRLLRSRFRRGGCGGGIVDVDPKRVVSGAAAAGLGGVTGQWIRHRFQNVFSFVSSLPGSTCS